tara:strand:- start:4561 stop:5460 length:900 start_codon:yes stop_codon:yes gene_type:complete
MNKVTLFSLAKFESDYIEEWVLYHISIGFDHIYLYDNEDIPTYKKLLNKYLDKVTIIHIPGNNYEIPIEYKIIRHYADNYLFSSEITHTILIGIDEFIVLKKHKNIKDFVNDYIKDDCGGIAFPWRHFGSMGKQKSNEPLTQRFTMTEDISKMCSRPCGGVFKTLFKVEDIEEWCWKQCTFKCGYNHMPIFKENKYCKTTAGEIIEPLGESTKFRPGYKPRMHFGKIPKGECKVKNINFDVIQLNHYKCKTLEEYRYLKTRGDACKHNRPKGDADFGQFDLNDIEDLTAKTFYKKNVLD